MPTKHIEYLQIVLRSKINMQRILRSQTFMGDYKRTIKRRKLKIKPESKGALG